MWEGRIKKALWVKQGFSIFHSLLRSGLNLKSKWGDRWGSNPRHPESQSGALPIELRSPLRQAFNL